MKKVLLLSLGLLIGFSAFAQQRVMKNDVREGVAYGQKAIFGKEVADQAVNPFINPAPQSAVVNRYDEYEDTETVFTYYDLQSNQYVANRMYQNPSGQVAVTATMSHETSNTSVPDRGTGYNFYDGSDWATSSLEEMTRVEPVMSGWPSIAQWGENGEILLSHGGGHLNCYTREVAGEGEWVSMGALPDYPEGYPYTSNYPTWPRVVTCGDNHNVAIVVATLQYTGGTETELHTCFFRSEDATNWEVSYGPIADLGLGYEHDTFSADDYCMAANGHTVALLYSGCLTNSVWMFKSTDDGVTWEATRVWEHPYEGISLSDPDLVYEDTLYMPMNGAITIDNNGVAHVALNTFEMAHWADTQAGYYNYFYGRTVDGILYWNDTQEAPIQSPDGNPFHAARLWWPDPENPGYSIMDADSTRWIGYIPMFQDENGNYISWSNDMYFTDDYHSKFYGASGHPALSCDPNGNLCCAFSAPCTRRTDETYYYRSIFASYYNVDEGYWHQVEDELTDMDVIWTYMLGECLFTCAAPNTVNPGEYWFSWECDDVIGLWWGSSASQTSASDNYIHVAKVIADPAFASVPENNDAKDVVYAVYPNPATDYMVVSSAMSAEATVTIYNLVGQRVQQFNKHLNTGENTINIDLKSGVYFCTISANGFDKTVKVVVK